MTNTEYLTDELRRALRASGHAYNRANRTAKRDGRKVWPLDLASACNRSRASQGPRADLLPNIRAMFATI